MYEDTNSHVTSGRLSDIAGMETTTSIRTYTVAHKAPHAGAQRVQFPRLGEIHMFGDLGVRTGLNYARLEGQWYRPDEVFVADKAGWPADWEGRLILALALHARSTRRTPAYLEEIMDRVPSHLNERGYFGHVLAAGVNDEQQMAGHSWYLRGVLEHHALYRDQRSLDLAASVIDNLLLPSAGNYARYPIDPATRWQSSHWKLSKLQTKSAAHAETSDCGCAFIMLDGATAAYEALRIDALKPLIEEMIARYAQVDFRGINVQTHATLSGMRGILRMHRLTGDTAHLDLVKRMYDLYTGVAWTEAYGNFNWFDVPRWTEPCGIIDSFILATQLWMATGKSRYLADAHHIYYNAMSHALRQTGAFGTDTCVGPCGVLLKPMTYEVTWCCTMRGGEALTRATEYALMSDGDTLVLPFYHNLRATVALAGGTATVRERTGYPHEGTVALTLEKCDSDRPVSVRMFVPPGALNPRVTLNGALAPVSAANGMLTVVVPKPAGATVELAFDLPLRAEQAIGQATADGYFTWRHGPMLLGLDAEQEHSLRPDTALEDLGGGRYRVRESNVTLAPLHDIRRLTAPETSRQVLFKAPV
jgi:uncharacterized protein